MTEVKPPPEPSAQVTPLDNLSIEELRNLVNLYGSAIAQICIVNNLDTIFVPHIQLPPGTLMWSHTPLGVGFSYLKTENTKSNPHAKLN